MRSLYPDSAYFEFLDGIRGECEIHLRLAAARLTIEFPGLRAEEAHAVCCDWQARTRIAARADAAQPLS